MIPEFQTKVKPVYRAGSWDHGISAWPGLTNPRAQEFSYSGRHTLGLAKRAGEVPPTSRTGCSTPRELEPSIRSTTVWDKVQWIVAFVSQKKEGPAPP